MRGSDMLDERIVFFMTVVEEGSFSAAARKLLVTQPAVSQRVSALERAVGTALLDRGGYRPVPTEAGRRLYEGAHAINLACDELVGLLGLAGPSLTIGFTGASQNRELLDFTRQFRRDHPDVRLDFRKDTFDGCRRQLLDGSVDCSFGIENTYRDLESVRCERLFDYEICVVCSLDSPLAGRPFVTPADIRGEDFVVFKPEYGRLFYRDFMDLLHEDGVRPHVVKSVSSFDELVFSVSMGEGIALVSTNVVDSEQVAIVPLRESSVHSTYVCAWRGNASPALVTLLNAARSFFSSDADGQ